MSMSNATLAELNLYAYEETHIHDDRRAEFLVVCFAMAALAFLAAGLRFYAESILHSSWKMDDYLIIATLGCTAAFCANAVICVHFGFGRHAILAGPRKAENFIKTLFAFEIMYNITIVLIKTSVLLFYRRALPLAGFRMVLNVATAFVIAWGISATLGVTFQCVPISYLWKHSGPAQCINQIALVISTAAINVFTDLFIVILPIPLVWRLQATRRKRLAVSGIFVLGGVVIIASVMRFPYLKHFLTRDPTWDAVDIAIWSVVEVCFGIVGACLPLMGPLIRNLDKQGRIRTMLFNRGTWRRSSSSNSSDCTAGSAVYERPWPGQRWPCFDPEEAAPMPAGTLEKILPRSPRSFFRDRFG
ncbi:MAG: hypothetical protein M1838_000930 [Thelocarpon superellum]|nr:MAG: hypothetical protein M1838_000930 [Thelocarpon superellum]